MEYKLSAVTANNINNLRAVTWELIREHTLRDSQLIDLMCLIKLGFLEQKSALSPQLDAFWNQREDLLIIDDVILMQHRAIIPKSLRHEVLQALHSAHQGEAAMGDRARQTVYWPCIDHDIILTRKYCYSCNRNAPSQPRLPAVEPHIHTLRTLIVGGGGNLRFLGKKSPVSIYYDPPPINEF